MFPDSVSSFPLWWLVSLFFLYALLNPSTQKRPSPAADDGLDLSRLRPTSSADPLAFDDKGDNDWDSNDTDDDPQAYTPHRQVKPVAGNRQARHECSSIRAADANSGQIDSFFDVISISNRTGININGINSG